MMKRESLAMNNFLVLTLVATSIIAPGCGLVKPRENLTIEQKENLVHTAGQTAISLALMEIYKKPEDQIKMATELKAEIDKNVLNGILLDPNGTVDETTEKLVFAKIPPKYAIYIQSAMALFHAYYETPKLGEVLTQDNWLLLTALFKGISDGCQLVIDVNTKTAGCDGQHDLGRGGACGPGHYWYRNKSAA